MVLATIRPGPHGTGRIVGNTRGLATIDLEDAPDGEEARVAHAQFEIGRLAALKLGGPVDRTMRVAVMPLPFSVDSPRNYIRFGCNKASHDLAT